MIEAPRNARLDALFCCVVAQMATDLESIANAIRSNPGGLDASDRAYRIAHSLHGAGSLYGYPCVSELGAALERLTDTLRANRLPPTDAVVPLLLDCAAALRGVTGPNRTDPAVIAKLSELAWKCECLLRE